MPYNPFPVSAATLDVLKDKESIFFDFARESTRNIRSYDVSVLHVVSHPPPPKEPIEKFVAGRNQVRLNEAVFLVEDSARDIPVPDELAAMFEDFVVDSVVNNRVLPRHMPFTLAKWFPSNTFSYTLTLASGTDSSNLVLFQVNQANSAQREVKRKVWPKFSKAVSAYVRPRDVSALPLDFLIIPPNPFTPIFPAWFAPHIKSLRQPLVCVPIEPSCLLHDQLMVTIERMGAITKHVVGVELIVDIRRYCMYRQFCQSHDIQREVWVVHGAPGHSVESIKQTGLDRIHNKGGGRSRMGIATYTALRWDISMDDDYSPPDGQNIKHFFLCRALPGRSCVEVGAMHNMKSAPQGFDTTVDDVVNPSILAIYDNARVIPEFHIKMRV